MEVTSISGTPSKDLEHLAITEKKCSSGKQRLNFIESLNYYVSEIVATTTLLKRTVGNQFAAVKEFASPSKPDLDQDRADIVKQKRNDQGCHECEVLDSRSEAAESVYQWSACTKNHGHHKFIPVQEFCLDHLPKWCQRKFVFDMVRIMLVLTVRLRVTYTSWERPKGYSFYNHRGSDVLHTGTGFVLAVVEGKGPCQCRSCTDSSSPHQKWYQILVHSACHVVFNTEEAQHTKVDFFYDDKTSRLTSLWVTQAIATDPLADTCTLLCATHEEALAEKLYACVRKIENHSQDIKMDRLSKDLWRLCVVVSHPHGQPKYVTVGRGLKKEAQSYVYITDTCPGSSGAPVLVFIPDDDQLKMSDTGDLSFVAPHSEWLPDEELNQSGWARCFNSPFVKYLEYQNMLRDGASFDTAWKQLFASSIKFPE
ncbi:hypothetical protein PoB_002641600 [Plakobranchus ocellatus]|uniref:Uncharacterized protein n=1 Tax=Plakobranchus ocellatus TaxID=259542 RepID=A0AAV3ZZG1_9GAST|nr:hypothetical protein PoB_002641600 [Plakobranchus ocellatus]